MPPGPNARGEAVDDPAAAALEHRRQHRLRAQQWAPEVDVHHAVPLVDGHVAEPVLREVLHDGGVVHEDVDAAEGVDGGARHGLCQREIAHVDGHADGGEIVGLQCVRSLGGGVLGDVGQHHRGPGFAECASVGRADAAGTTGEQRSSRSGRRALRRSQAVLSPGLDGSRFVVKYRGCERFSQVL